MDEAPAHSTDYIDGFREGYLQGYKAGLSDGRAQGYDDAAWRAAKAVKDCYDSDVKAAIRQLVGDYEE